MKTQELLEQLNTLKEIKPDSNWKKSQKELILNQIGVSQGEKYKSTFVDVFKVSMSTLRIFSQSATAAFLLIGIVLVGGIASLTASSYSKPGDSLYMAKIAKEKTQFALTFSEKKKLELGLSFATKRAEELKELIEEEGNGEKEEKVERLVENFKKEIQAAKQRVAKMGEIDVIVEESFVSDIQEEDAENVDDSQTDSEIFSAGLSKEDDGLEVSENNKSEAKEIDSEIMETEEIIEANASTTIKQSSSSEEIIIEASEPIEIIEKASQLLEEENYSEAYDILVSAEEAIESGEVKGVEESASSSEESFLSEEEIVDDVIDEDVGTSTIE